jgi:hypothetical protein
MSSSSLHLDLRDYPSVMEFINQAVEFLPSAEQKPYLELEKDLEEGKSVSLSRVMEMVPELGARTWAARYALNHFLRSIGSEFEWKEVIAAARPTTALLLKRLKEGIGSKTMDEALKSSDAAMAIHDEEEIELAALRPEVRLKIWHEHQKALQPMVKEAEVEVEAIKKRLKRLREIAVKVKEPRSSELLGKAEQLEDRFYFGAEVMPLEALDAEIRYDAEEEAIPSTDDALIDAEQLPVRFEIEGEGEEEQVSAEEEEKPKKRGRKKKQADIADV